MRYACYERDRIAKLVVGPRFETGRARIEPSDNGGALLEAFDDAKRVRPSVGARHRARERRRESERERGERRERHARSLFPRISGTLSALLARITHTQPQLAQQNRTESFLLLLLLLPSFPPLLPSPLPARILLD